MDIGQLNSRVVIEQRSTSTDALGQPVETWTTFATLWASIKHASGLETIKAGADASIVKASIRIRYRTDVTAAMRVKHHGTVYEINAVLPDEESAQYADLVCTRVP